MSDFLNELANRVKASNEKSERELEAKKQQEIYRKLEEAR